MGFFKQYLLDLKTPFLAFSRDVLPPTKSCGPSKWSSKKWKFTFLMYFWYFWYFFKKLFFELKWYFCDQKFNTTKVLSLKTPFLRFSRDVLSPKKSCGPPKWSSKIIIFSKISKISICSKIFDVSLMFLIFIFLV